MVCVHLYNMYVYKINGVCAQVMQVVREQIVRVLAMKPLTLDQLKVKLYSLSYSEILRLRHSERVNQDDFHSAPIM